MRTSLAWRSGGQAGSRTTAVPLSTALAPASRTSSWLAMSSTLSPPAPACRSAARRCCSSPSGSSSSRSPACETSLRCASPPAPPSPSMRSLSSPSSVCGRKALLRSSRPPPSRAASLGTCAPSRSARSPSCARRVFSRSTARPTSQPPPACAASPAQPFVRCPFDSAVRHRSSQREPP